MKERFLIHFTLPDYFDKEMWDSIPAQRNMVNRLMEERVILNYSMDMERRHLWIFLEAEDLASANKLVKKLPISKFVKIRIHELAFFDSAPVGLPELYLN